MLATTDSRLSAERHVVQYIEDNRSNIHLIERILLVSPQIRVFRIDVSANDKPSEGAARYVHKPFGVHVLLVAIHQPLDHK